MTLCKNLWDIMNKALDCNLVLQLVSLFSANVGKATNYFGVCYLLPPKVKGAWLVQLPQFTVLIPLV